MSNVKKVVVTGGAGFIGSYLVERLAEQDYQVTIIDDLSSGKMENIESLLEKGQIDFIKGSITDKSLLNKVFAGASLIFHLAAIASVPQSLDNPIKTHEVNVNGTLVVLTAARENGVEKVVYASSSAVYGDTTVIPTNEDTPTHPLSPYAVTKLTGEHYCRIFHMNYGLPVACLRIFNVYGPRQDPYSHYAAAIPLFIRKVIDGKSIIIFDDGEQTRDLIYVRDVVEACILAAASNATGIYNIASGKSVTVNELVELIVRLGGKSPDLIYQEPRPGDIRHSLADIGRAETFGFKPGYNLETGLKETIEYFWSK